MSRSGRVLSLAGLAAAGFACGGSVLDGGTPEGMLAGEVTVGPFCPVEIEGEACPPPAGTYESIRVLVYVRLGQGDRLVAETRPDATGRFELLLPSGSYRVALEHSIGIPGAPRAVTEARVEPGATTTIAFDIDTGIR